MQQTDSQIYDCLNYINKIKKEGDQIIEIDESDVSTRLKPEQRPVLLSMLTMLEKGDTLVVFCLTRLARTGIELTNIYAELIDRKVNIVSLCQPKIDDVIIHLYAAGGQIERNSNSLRTKSALKHKQSRMEKVGQCWYGYKTDPNILNPRENVRTSGKPYKLIPDEYEQSVIKQCIRLREEGYSLNEIANQLNAQGYTNRNGQPFQKMTIHRVLARDMKRDICPQRQSLALSH